MTKISTGVGFNAFTRSLFILETFLFKENRGITILTVRTKKLRKETGDRRFGLPSEVKSQGIAQIFRAPNVRAVKLLVKEPILSIFGAYLALSSGVVFLFLSVINITFDDIHGWSEGKVGSTYTLLIPGCFIDFATGFWQDHLYSRRKNQNDGMAVLEARLYSVKIFLPLFGLDMTIYAWTVWTARISCWGQLFALTMILVGIYHVFLSVYSFAVDVYAKLDIFAIAGQGLMHKMLSAVMPLFAQRMFMEWEYNGQKHFWKSLRCS